MKLTIDSKVRDIVNHPAFKGFGELLLPWDDNSEYYDLKLSNVASLMPYHQNIDPSLVVETINNMIEDTDRGLEIFYDFYSKEQKQIDTSKEKTGLFFFRGRPGAPFAIISPGGAFSYVGSMHEGFPIAKKISDLGYNAFVIRYRLGGELIACQDLAAVISFILDNSSTLKVDSQNYSLWGGSAGAIMAARLASYLTTAYGNRNLPGPNIAIILYTGHKDWTPNDPPTFTIVGELDKRADPIQMEKRVKEMTEAGIDTSFKKYPGLGHGFGLGDHTSAEGWVENAIKFWEKYI
jgi:acetyl esterase/lipase